MGEDRGVTRLNWKPPRVFYGWWIVAASFLIATYTGGVIFYGFTAIFEPIASEFGWDYAQISLAASLRGLEIGLLAPLVGILVDRLGPRRLVFSGVIISGLGLILLSRTTSLGMFYGAFAVLAIGVSASTSAVLMAAVANWFRRRVGIATGIAVSGFGFGGIFIPAIVRLIDLYEWRTTMFIFALGIWVIGLPLSLLIRHKPEQYGCLPDGEENSAVVTDNSLAQTQTVEVDIGVKQVLKSRTFWHITLALTFQITAVMAVITHVMPYLSSKGITRSVSSLVATTLPLLSIGGRLGFGWLGDKFDKKRVAVGSFIMTVLGLLCFEYTSTGWAWLLVPFLILFGISLGGNMPLRVSLLMEYFGRSNFGTILGFMLGTIALVSMAGPPFAGWVFDNWGSYQGAWLAFAGLTVMGVVIVATTPPVSTTPQAIDRVS